MKTLKNIRQNKYIVFILTALIIAIMLCFCTFDAITFADETNIIYSNVLDDLKKDENFKPENYPQTSSDYSIKLMQFGESVNKELFVYVYQPSGQAKILTASSINLSTTINDNISYRNYKLKLLNSNGVFFKYKVENLEVRNEPTRYYAVSSIFRYFDETIDKQADSGNKITEIPFNVSKQFCYSILNGKPYCSVVDLETITITDKFVGFCRYSNGFELFPSACDSHFVAFDTDKPIDKLLEADVYYTSQAYTGTVNLNSGSTSERKDFGVKEDKYAYLKYTDKVEHTGGGWFAGTYKWNRIETVEQFIKKNDLSQDVYSGAIIDVRVGNKLTDEAKNALKSKKWILRFAETEYKFTSSTFIQTTNTTLVGDVTILRLKFETDGITYNLGTIDNKQTGSDNPSNNEETDYDWAEWLKKFGQYMLLILIIILVVLLLIVLWPIIKLIIQFIVWIVCLPFKAIASLFKKNNKNDKQNVNDNYKKPKRKKYKKSTNKATPYSYEYAKKRFNKKE